MLIMPHSQLLLHLQNLRSPSPRSVPSPATMEAVNGSSKTGKSEQKKRYAKQLEDIEAWAEFVRKNTGKYAVDYSEPLSQYHFTFAPVVLNNEDDEKKKQRLERQLQENARRNRERQKYMLSGMFLAATMTGLQEEKIKGQSLYVAEHQGVLIRYEQNENSEKFSASGLKGDIADPRVKTDDRYLNNLLLENIKTAYILVQNAKLSGWESMTFGNTKDPIKRYALKLACERLRIDCSREEANENALPQDTAAKEKLLDHMKAIEEEYLNFPLDPPRFEEKQEPKPDVTMADEAPDAQTRNFVFSGLKPLAGFEAKDIKDENREELASAAEAKGNFLAATLPKHKIYSDITVKNSGDGTSIVTLTLTADKKWDEPLTPSGQGPSSTPAKKSILNVLKKLAEKIATQQSQPALTDVFLKESTFAYAIERLPAQYTVRADHGYLQFSGYDEATKEISIDLAGSCNSGCEKLGTTQSTVEKAIKEQFPEDVKTVRFVEQPGLALAA